MLLILLAGMPGSGKSIVAKAASEAGLPVVNMGDVVREETLRRYGEITPALMLKTSIELRAEYGEDYIAVKTVEKIPRNAKIVVVDGVRSLAEVEAFRRLGKPVILAVHASPKTRFERLLKRSRPGDPKSLDEFNKRDEIELKLGVGSVIALADYVIVNEGSVEEVLKEAKRIIEKVVSNAEDNC
jgi:dephospho-CoA kinase